MRRALLLFLGGAIATGAFGACVDFQPADPPLEGGTSADGATDGATPDGDPRPLVGPRDNGDHEDVLPVGAAEAFRTPAARAGTAGRVRLFVRGGNEAPNAIVGLYDETSNRPDRLLGSAMVSITNPPGWFEGTLTSPIEIKAGTTYWVALLNPQQNDPSQLLFRSTDMGNPAFDHNVPSLAALPMTWATNSQDFGNAPAAIQLVE